MTKRHILVLCTGNSARSQMAEGLLRHDFGDRVEVASAGTHPSRVRPEAVAVMNEIGIDISWHRSKRVDQFQGQSFDDVVTVCAAADARCPAFAGAARRHHRNFADPVAVWGSEDRRLDAFRQLRDELREWLAALIEEPGQRTTRGVAADMGQRQGVSGRQPARAAPKAAK